MGPKSFGEQNHRFPKVCWTQNIGVHLELKENLELECGPAPPNLFISFSLLVHDLFLTCSLGIRLVDYYTYYQPS